jgi:hypothetical protein
LAVFCWRSLSSVADNEGAGGCFDLVVGDGFELLTRVYPSVNGHYVLPTGGQLMCPLVASKTAG